MKFLLYEKIFNLEKRTLMNKFAPLNFQYSFEVKSIIEKIGFFLSVIILGSCANMAQGPSGGYMDTIPPRMVKCVPQPNATNVSNNKIEVYFDEYIQLNNAQQEIMISPTQENQFSVKGIGKKVLLELNDSLLPNTTYTIDFGKTVKDFREGNPYEDFVFSFSTGGEIDTLSFSGFVLDANTLLPQKGMLVGVYASASDTNFTTRRVERVALTHEDGSFVLHNLKPQAYELVAIADQNGNKYFDVPNEKIAFAHGLVTPSVERVAVADAADSTKVGYKNRFVPDSLVLFSFEEETRQQFFEKADRPKRNYVSFKFKNVEKVEPEIKLLNVSRRDWGLPEGSLTKDTFSFWLKDTLLSKMDTLRFAIKFQKYDSTSSLVSSYDTLDLISKTEKSRRRKKTQEHISYLSIASSSNPVGINENFQFTWESPVVDFTSEKAHVQVLVDTVWTDIGSKVIPADDVYTNNRKFQVDFKMEPEKKYRILIDSASVHDIYGNFNDKINLSTRIRSKEEYSDFSIKLKNYPKSAIVELLQGKNVKRYAEVDENGVAKLQNVLPGEYVVRLVSDLDGNKQWTTGNFKQKRQPEAVYYYEKKIKLKANWDFDEDWDVGATSVIEQSKQQSLMSNKK